MNAFLSGALAGYGIAIPVGPIAVLIVQVGIRCGFLCAGAAATGAATADLAFAAAAVAGGAAVAGLIASVETLFRLLSAIVLLAVAIAVFVSSRRPQSRRDTDAIAAPREYVTTYFKFLGMTIVNPPTVAYFVAFIVGLGLAEDLTVAGGGAFIAGAFLASLSWQLVLAATGAVAGAKLSGRVQRVTGVVGSVVVAAMAVAVLVR